MFHGKFGRQLRSLNAGKAFPPHMDLTALVVEWINLYYCTVSFSRSFGMPSYLIMGTCTLDPGVGLGTASGFSSAVFSPE